MPAPDSRSRNATKPDRTWWDCVQRVYLDSTVFETSDSLKTLIELVLPEVRHLHSVDGSARLVVHELSRDQLSG